MRTRKWLVSAGGARVAGVQVTFVFDGKLQRRELLGEPPPQPLFAGRSGSRRRRSGGRLGGRLRLAAQPQHLRDHEEQHRHADAEDLEVHPDALGKVPRHVDVRRREQRKPASPQRIDEDPGLAGDLSGSLNTPSSMRRASGCLPTTMLPRKAAAVSASSTVGFH